MNTASAPLLVPSLLPDDTEEWVRSFVFRLRDKVAGPLFAAPDADTFAEQAPELLICGAALRFRWINALSKLPDVQSAALRDVWMRPLPPALLSDLQRRAAVLLGDERSFQVRRALAMTFTDGMEGVASVLERWNTPLPAPRRLIEWARLAEASAFQDVLSIAWMMVLCGDVPAPSPEVAEAAATSLLELTAGRLSMMQAILRDEIRSREVPLDDRGAPGVLQAHPQLAEPLLLLLGFALDDETVEGLVLTKKPDPEDAALSFVELRLLVRGEPDEARLRLEERALRAGALSVMGDDQGTLLTLTAQAAPRR